MNNQIIVTIGREHGSGGHYIGKLLSQKLNIDFYDREIVQGVNEISGYSRELIRKLDEKPKNFFLSRRVGDFSNSLEENVAEKTFEFLRSLAESGQSFVVVGRCADYVLRDNPHAFRLFICGDYAAKLRRVMEREGIRADKAKELIRSTDRQRKAYHNFYCDTKWGDSRGYDLAISSSKLGLEATADILARCIETFRAQTAPPV